jgi:hypothetical protein
VLDFCFAEDRCYYLKEIKSIRTNALNPVWDAANMEEVISQYKEKTNQTVCKLCGFSFGRKEISKIVTNKLILELVEHMKNRGKEIKCHLQSSVIPSASSNVCNLCYDLIVAEHRLIDIEHEFQILVNVNTDEIMRVRNLLPQSKKQ